MTLLDSLKALQSVEGQICKDQSMLLAHIDSLELVSVPEYPRHFLVEIGSFEELGRLASAAVLLHSEFKEALQAVAERVHEIPALVGIVRSFKSQLNTMKLKFHSDSQHFQNAMRRVSTVLTDFRLRCKQEFSQFLLELDTDIRSILKPLVPTEVIKTALRFPSIGPSLHSSIASEDKEEEVTAEAVTQHIHMLVSSLEKVAKQLVDLLEDTRRKYFEFTDPIQLGATPLGAALPEFFSYGQLGPQPKSPRDQPSINLVKERVSDLRYSGELTQPQAESLQKCLDSGQSCETFFQNLDFSLSRKEDLVFKLINSGNQVHKVEQSMINSTELRELQKVHFSAPRTEKFKRAFARQKHGLMRRSEKRVSRLPELNEPSPPAYPMPSVNGRNKARRRSITPTDWSTRSVKNKNIKFLIKH